MHELIHGFLPDLRRGSGWTGSHVLNAMLL
jgi:hypothetical protein